MMIELSREHIQRIMPKRTPISHKGDYGKVLIIGGSIGMTGSVCLSSEAALRSGCGLVKIATTKDACNIISSRFAETMTLPNSMDENAIDVLLSASGEADVVLLGPGLGRGSEKLTLVRELTKKIECPMIIDADGLFALSQLASFERKGETILTPHTMEMSRLMGVSCKEIEEYREKIAIEAAQKYNSTVVLKGHNSVIASTNGDCYINPTGNSGMATAGSGDVLAGIISGIVAQTKNCLSSTLAGVYLHGYSGDIAAENLTEYSVIASDLIKYLPPAIKQILAI